MGNKLRDLFQPKDSEEVYSFTWESEEAKQDFEKALQVVYRTGKSVAVKGAKTIEKCIVEGDNKYPVEHGEITETIVISPPKEMIDIPIIVEGQEKKIRMNKSQYENHCIVETDGNSSVYVKLDFHLNEKQLLITNKVCWEKAKTCRDFLKDIKEAGTLLNTVAKNSPEWTKNERQKQRYDDLAYLFSMIVFLEEKLGVEFSPNIVRTHSDQWILVARLYRMLAFSKPVRDPSRIEFIDAGYEEEINAEEVAICYCFEAKYQLFEKEVSVHLSNVLFNVCVGKSEPLSNGKKRISFYDKDDKPMYGAHRAFLSAKDAENELISLQSVPDKINEYKDAKELNDVFERNT